MTRAPFTLVPMAVAALAVGSYDNYTEVSFGVPNPDFGRVISYQAPRSLRVGARFVF